MNAYYILAQLGQVHYTVLEEDLGQPHRGTLAIRMAKKAKTVKYIGPYRKELNPDIDHNSQMSAGRVKTPIYHDFRELMKIK